MQNKTKIHKKANWQSVFRVIKWVVPFFIALILYKKFYKNNAITFEAFRIQFISLDWYWYLILPLFAIVNWLLEIKKWQFLATRLENHSFRTAIKSVLSGVAVSQLLPYRTGEYLGRLAYISDENKIRAGVLSVAGSFSQLLITLIFGLSAFIILHPLDYPVSFTVSFILLLVLLLTGYVYLPQFNALKNNAFFRAIREALQVLKKADMYRLLLFSGLRYLAFLIPYALLALYFGLGKNDTLLYMFTAVACIYFLQTVSPNFILTDIAIRISVPALVFSGSFDQINGVDHLPGMIIYVFNVAVPMCLGAMILLLMKLRK